MTTLEQELIEKFRQLDKDAQQRVRAMIEDEVRLESEPATFDYAGWWAEVEALQAEIQARLGDNETVGALDLLEELREEAS